VLLHHSLLLPILMHKLLLINHMLLVSLMFNLLLRMLLNEVWTTWSSNPTIDSSRAHH
jgi:hypothetical protein